MTGRSYGRKKDGTPVDDALIEKLAGEADRGYAPGELSGKPRGRGRPPLGELAKEVESVRLEPELRKKAERRAAEDGTSVSEVIRQALRDYLRSA